MGSEGLLVLRKDNPEDCLMPCLMRRIAGEVGYADQINFVGDIQVTYRLMSESSAVAFFPYTGFTLTLEELQNLGIPMFVPTSNALHMYSAPLRATTKGGFLGSFERLAVFEAFR